MDRVLQTHTFGPHRLDVVEYPDDEGGGLVVILIDDVVVTDPPLPGEPSMDQIMHVYATWQAGSGGG